MKLLVAGKLMNGNLPAEQGGFPLPALRQLLGGTRHVQHSLLETCNATGIIDAEKMSAH